MEKEEPHIVDLRQLWLVAVANKFQPAFGLPAFGHAAISVTSRNQQEVTMAKTFGMLFGIIFLAIGILGFVPGITTNDMLLAIFMLNKPHTTVHIPSASLFLVP